MELKEEKEEEKEEDLRVISIKDNVPSILCVDKNTFQNPLNLIRFIKEITNKRKIKSIEEEVLVIEYTFNLRPSDEPLPALLRSEEISKEPISEDSIKIAVADNGGKLLKIGVFCNSALAEPRKNIERLVENLKESGMVFNQKANLIGEKNDEIYITNFNYLPDSKDKSKKTRSTVIKAQKNKINFLEKQVGFTGNLLLTLLSENPKLLEKPEIIDYLNKQGIPNDLFSLASAYKKRNIFLRGLYKVIEEDTGITREQIESSKKPHEIAEARHIMMYLLKRKFKNLRLGSSTKIGEIMGGKNHATVLFAYRHFQYNGKEFPFELTGDIETDYQNAKSLYHPLNPKKNCNSKDKT